MIRLFDTHKVRKQVELSGIWDFQAVGAEDGLPAEYSVKLPVPGCWEQHPDYLKYRGVGVYRKTVVLDKSSNIRLEFKGVSHTADVYFDGKHIAHHYNAYTPFSAAVMSVPAGEHEIVVRVDNRFTGQSALHIGNDYYTYGGITRTVALEYLENALIERIEFIPSLEDGKWTANLKIHVKNLSDTAQRLKPVSKIAGETVEFDSAEVGPEASAVFNTKLSFKEVKAWSNEAPKLYMLETSLFDGAGNEIDDLIERVGFREIRVEGYELRLNGRPINLKGFNRHEDYGIVGCSIPLQLMMKDLDLMKEMGSNTVRTCHYPNDELFLDLCDELGFYVWEENHARGLTLEHMQNPNFDRQCEDCIREMIENHINHPSIIIWGILNECAGDTEEGRVKYKKQFDQIRRMDGSRPVTTAMCHYFKELTLEYVDIVSLNVYSGWYNDRNIADFYKELNNWSETNGAKGKPVIMSEFGAAAIYGYRDPARPKWSEERQSDIIAESLDFYMSRPEIVGNLLWQFCDCRVTEENNWFMTRARTHNNKGVVDDYRRPKLAFETVKSKFKG